jgi:Domain of unknown function DUF29
VVIEGRLESAMKSLYEQDFYAWSNEQVALLRAGKLGEADIPNIIEEIDSMGRSERRELVNRLVILLLHLLKWRYQPALRGNSWRLSIKEQRIRLASHMADNPSLKSNLDEAIVQAYLLAAIEAERETGLSESSFPSICPFSFAQLMDDAFWPSQD